MEKIKYLLLMLLSYPIFGEGVSSLSIIDVSNLFCRVGVRFGGRRGNSNF